MSVVNPFSRRAITLLVPMGLGPYFGVAAEDNDLLELLRAISTDGWQELDEVIDRLRAEPRPYEWRGGERTANGSIQMPWVHDVDAVRAARDWLDRHRLVTPLADWTSSWYEPRRFPDAPSVEEMSAGDAVRLATSIVRADRFSEGTIAGALDSGVLPAVLVRLRRWYDDS